MVTLGLLAGIMLLLLGISELSNQHNNMQNSRAAEFTGTIAEVHCSTERKQPAVKLRLTTHSPAVWFHTNRNLLGQVQPCNVLQSAMAGGVMLRLLAANSQIIGLRIDNEQIYQPADWYQYQRKNAVSMSLCGLTLCVIGFFSLYRRFRNRIQNTAADHASKPQ